MSWWFAACLKKPEVLGYAQYDTLLSETVSTISRSMTSLSETAREIFEQALADCSIEKAMARRMIAREGYLSIDGAAMALADLRHLRIVAVGKAGGSMLAALWDLLPELPDCDIAGVLIAPEPVAGLPECFEYFAGGHPLPNEASFAGARAALDMAGRVADPSTLCLFLISGGASAMMELPLDPAISLGDTAEFHRALVGSGASIREINCVRKHFSAVKGGRLALAAGNARCHSLLVSDVPAGREDALGSGPTLPDRSTVEECREILARYKLLPQFPSSVRSFFESERLAETPKPDELEAGGCVLLGAEDLAKAAARRATALGWSTAIDNSCDEWEYRAAARHLLERLREMRQEHARVCVISAGEVAVTLPANESEVGAGGRNQQFALYAASLLTSGDGNAAILSAGSDGIDGNSPAAGAVVDEQLLAEAGSREAGLRALERFDAYPFLQGRGAALVCGATGNNLRDLRILLGS